MVRLYASGKPRAEIIKEYNLTASAFDKWVRQHQTSGSFEEKDYVMFLYPADEVENAFWITGVYQGKFKMKNSDQLFYDADSFGGFRTFQDDVENLEPSELKEKIKKVKN